MKFEVCWSELCWGYKHWKLFISVHEPELTPTESIAVSLTLTWLLGKQTLTLGYFCSWVTSQSILRNIRRTDPDPTADIGRYSALTSLSVLMPLFTNWPWPQYWYYRQTHLDLIFSIDGTICKLTLTSRLLLTANLTSDIVLKVTLSLLSVWHSHLVLEIVLLEQADICIVFTFRYVC